MDASRVFRIREEMERAEARRLQPHYIESFFLEAFQGLGGTIKQREPRRYEMTHVPAPIRNRDRLTGIGEPVVPRYERVVFEKDLVTPPGQALAAFVCPGHPLLGAALDLVLERNRDLLRRGTVLVENATSGRIGHLYPKIEITAEMAKRADLTSKPLRRSSKLRRRRLALGAHSQAVRTRHSRSVDPFRLCPRSCCPPKPSK